MYWKVEKQDVNDREIISERNYDDETKQPSQPHQFVT